MYWPAWYMANCRLLLSAVSVPCFLHWKEGNAGKSGNRSQCHWYLSGHSLGGAMAAAYASEHLESFNGLVFLAAYPTKSLKSDSFSVLSLYGSEDGVLNMEKVEEGRAYMPVDYAEVCIEGGNHAQFGDYGEQKKDHAAQISREEQQKQTVDAILKMIELSCEME